jgi:NAD(P)-dependent dehydrogenase (short-subunit alcohol dehydrogenase family)
VATNVVVGGASGMGAAIARELAPRGRLVIADRDAEGAARLATELATEVGGRVEAIAYDLTHVEQHSALVERIGPDLGALVVTAGLSPSMGPGHLIYDVNLIGLAQLLDAIAGVLTPRSVGLLFSTVAAHRVERIPEVMAVLDDPLAEDFFGRLRAVGVDPDSSEAAYRLSKLGVLRMVERLAPAWGSCDARILSLSPGATESPMIKSEMADNPAFEELLRSRPLRRMGRIEEIASVAAFLTSDGASYMTGTDVLVDGGMTLITPELKVR